MLGFSEQLQSSWEAFFLSLADLACQLHLKDVSTRYLSWSLIRGQAPATGLHFQRWACSFMHSLGEYWLKQPLWEGAGSSSLCGRVLASKQAAAVDPQGRCLKRINMWHYREAGTWQEQES